MEEKITEGSKPYVLTQLEFLCLSCNMINPFQDLLGTDLYIRCFCEKATDTIIVYISYSDEDINMDSLEEIYDKYSVFVKGIAKQYGWDSWANIKKSIVYRKE